MNIYYIQGNQTIEYAAEELKKYLLKLEENISVSLKEVELFSDAANDGIKLGLFEDLGISTLDVDDAFVDDVIDIDVKCLNGHIAGSNPRSILQGVYVFLKSAGCMWVRPGDDGEYIPKFNIENHSYTYHKKADYPFRGQCCEGAISYEHMRDTVYWLPKVGMNMYMIEGVVPYTYMHKWYGHIGNRFLRQKGQVTDYDMLERYIEKLEKDIVKVGLQHHAMGHGWMFEKFGVKRGNPEVVNKNLKEEHKKYLAKVNGVRDLMKNSTFFTHFCYSNPEARKILVDFCVEYVKKKPHIDFLHIWLADSINNQCECDGCVKMTPSDYYVILLNEIEEALSKEGLKTRLVFIMYVDTERPPEKVFLKNPHKFIFTAAIGNPYETGYSTEEYKGKIPPFERNNFKPNPNPLRMHWHKEWKRVSGNCKSFVFEYRFYTDHYCDPGYMRVARETYRDMTNLHNASFQGCMNDQTHRIYMPTSLPVLIMGETLFNKELDFEKYTKEYFEAAFGEADAAKCREYLETLSTLFCPANIRKGGKLGVEDEGIAEKDNGYIKSWINNPEVYMNMEKIPVVLEAFKPVIERNLETSNKCQHLSWEYLKYHMEICLYLCEIYKLGAKGDIDAAREVLDRLEIYVSNAEMDIHNGFDLFLFVKFVRAKLDLPMYKYFD